MSDAPTPEEEAIHAEIVKAIKTVFDPEIPVNIYDLGLIYSIALDGIEGGQYHAKVRMTLTSPHCPSAAELPEEVRIMALSAESVASAEVELVWDPPWDRSMMSEEAKMSLGFF